MDAIVSDQDRRTRIRALIIAQGAELVSATGELTSVITELKTLSDRLKCRA